MIAYSLAVYTGKLTASFFLLLFCNPRTINWLSGIVDYLRITGIIFKAELSLASL